MHIPEDCIDRTSVKKIVLDDQSRGKGRSKSKITFLNPKEILFLKIQVDGCAIQTGKRCDWLLMDGLQKSLRFVELKDSNLSDSISQLEATLKFYAPTYPNASKEAIIVSTKVPSGARTDLQNAKIRFQKAFGTPLKTARSGQVIPLN